MATQKTVPNLNPNPDQIAELIIRAKEAKKGAVKGPPLLGPSEPAGQKP